MTAIEDRVAALETVIGDLTKTIDQWRNGPNPPELSNHFYPVFKSFQQIYDSENSLNKQQASIEARVVALESGGVAIPPPVAGDAIAQLAAKGVYVQQNRIGVGIAPDPASSAALTVGGDSAAVIDGISNTKGTDGQNPGEVHKNSLVVADNDGGMRARQYAQWNGGTMTRNTTNRNLTVYAFMDSVGNWCISDSRWKGQVFYGVKDSGGMELITYQPGANMSIKESVAAYGAADKEIL